MWAEGEAPPHALTHGRRDRAARPRAHPGLGRGGRRLDDHRPARRRRAVAVLRLDARLCGEAARLEAPASAARAAAADLPDPAAGHGQGARRVRRLPLLAARSRATCRSRARRCSPTRSSSAPRRRSPGSSSRAASRPTPRFAAASTAAPVTLAAVPWLETPSDTFVARHDARDALDVERVLAQLEHTRARLDARFPARLGELGVVVHGSAAQLDAAEPWLPLQRRLTAPAGAPLPRRLGRRARAARARAAAARAARLERRGLARAADARPVGAARAALRRRQPPRHAAAVRAAQLRALDPLGLAARGRGAVLLRPGPPRAPGGRAAAARGRRARLPAGPPRRGAARRLAVRPARPRGGRAGLRGARLRPAPRRRRRRARPRVRRPLACATPRRPGARTWRGSPPRHDAGRREWGELAV